MKRLMLMLIAVFTIAVIAGCSVGAVEDNGTNNSDNADAVFHGKIVNVADDALLLISTEQSSTDLYHMSLADVKLTDDQGKAIAADQLNAGGYRL